ncbi:MAG: ribbon-helix-helix domain-containing protein, partial [Anaerolineaceae bacterium]|nr:ribbon-helix-helix domain-containing protein [Anaerolineaceae bacterium]
WMDLFRKVDEALYRAKRSGRNRVCLPVSAQMVMKTSYFTQVQLEKLSDLARKTGKSEAYYLREALDELLKRYE